MATVKCGECGKTAETRGAQPFPQQAVKVWGRNVTLDVTTIVCGNACADVSKSYAQLFVVNEKPAKKS